MFEKEKLPRDVLIYLSLLYKGDWNLMFEHIAKGLPVPPEEVKDVQKRIKSKVITLMDEDYPKYLLDCYKPPFVLYYYGDISLIQDFRKNLAIVGSRLLNSCGAKASTEFSRALSNKYVIVSGLAKGADALAHQGAIDMGGKTVAVLGSGIERCYPSENLALYEEIKKNHLLISEYPNYSDPDGANFPMRNRLIACMASGVLLTQAKHRSGTAITAFFALEMNRAICAIPYRYNEDSLCNALIYDGAKMALEPQDVIEEIESHNFTKGK